MPSTIPYDPSLTLCSVVSESQLRVIKQIAQTQALVDAAQQSLDALVASRKSLLSTKTELANLCVPTDDIDVEIRKFDKSIKTAGAEYAKAKVEAAAKIQGLRKGVRTAVNDMESPVDDSKCEIKVMPIAADSVNMDTHYFSFDSTQQDSASYSTQILSYVSRSTGSVLGPVTSDQVGAAVSRQVSRQIGSRTVRGTLVLCVSCTHKNASMVAPFVLQPDKAIKVWNHLFPGSKLDPTDKSSMMKIATSESQEDKQKYSIVSGTTFGSCFVGVMHVLDASGASEGDSMSAAAQSLTAKVGTGSWNAGASGNIGLDSKFAGDMEKMLKQQDVQSLVTLVSAGVDLSAAAAEVRLAANRTAASDSKSLEEHIAAMQKPACFVEDGADKILDVESMINALDHYLKKAVEYDSGIPLNYYLKDIDQKMLVQMWASKYYPGQYMAIKYDDTEGAVPNEVKRAQARR